MKYIIHYIKYLQINKYIKHYQIHYLQDGATDVGREAEEVPSSWGRIIKEIEVNCLFK